MNTTRKNAIRRAGLPVLLAMAVLCGSDPARANHTNLIHGAMCSTSAATFSYDSAAIGFPGTSSGSVYCPIVNADPGTITGAKGLVKGWDGDAGLGAYICNGVVRNWNSEVIAFTAGDAQAPLGANKTGAITIPDGVASDGNLNFGINITSDDAVDIGCALPPGSWLYTYRVDNL